MTLNNALQQARKDLERTVTDAKPLHAMVGATDLAAQQLRVAGDRFGTLRTDVKSAPGKAQQVFGDVVHVASSTYDDLAGRGKGVLDRIGSQQESASTATANTATANTTTTKPEAAAKSSTKSASASGRTSAKKSTGSTTKKSAGPASKSTKSARSTKSAKSTSRSSGKQQAK